jgi:hypothetical protein
MHRGDLELIREATAAAQQFAHTHDLEGCDKDDIDEIVEPVEQELKKAQPNPQTLSTYLNSLARSLRANPAARSICMQLDTAMRAAGLPTNWAN